MRFPEFSGEWERCKVKDFTKVVAGATPSTSNKEYWGGDIRWMNSGELNLKRVYEVQGRITQLGYEKTSTKIIPPQSVLIGLAGQGKTRGTAAINYVELCTNQSIASILPSDKYYPEFLYQNIESRYKELRDISSGDGGRGGLNLQMIYNLNIPYCSISEQRKIGDFLCLLDQRIETQRKIIEDLKKLKDAITHFHFRNELAHSPMTYIGQYITQVSRRNKDTKIDRVLSVSNKYGFVDQDEQFEDRVVASIDTSNYKVVQKGDFAYNPARINVGSVAILQEFENGIVSPMYVCFTTNKGLLPAYFELYLSTNIFKHEMYKRLEGSVRLCLTYESLCNIKIALPEFSVQTDLASKVSALLTKIKNEERLLCLYHNLKQYLLTQMFI